MCNSDLLIAITVFEKDFVFGIHKIRVLKKSQSFKKQVFFFFFKVLYQCLRGYESRCEQHACCFKYYLKAYPSQLIKVQKLVVYFSAGYGLINVFMRYVYGT